MNERENNDDLEEYYIIEDYQKQVFINQKVNKHMINMSKQTLRMKILNV